MPVRAFVTHPKRLGFILFTETLIIQLFHEVEHIMQVMQKYAWHQQAFPGWLGQWFDLEWVHFLYNGTLFLALLALWIVYRKNPGIGRTSALGAVALIFVVFFQGYHWLEHAARLVQYYQGMPKPPGFLGQVFPLLELHFWFNTVVSVAMLFAYFRLQPWTRRGKTVKRTQLAEA